MGQVPVQQQAPAGGVISGLVVNDAGAPVAGAVVVLETPTGADAGTTTRDSNGWFRFTELRSGRYTLRAVWAGVMSPELPVMLPERSGKQTRIVLDAAGGAGDAMKFSASRTSVSQG